MRISKVISQITSVLVCISVLLLLVPFSTDRAASTLGLSVSGNKEVGSSFTVTVGFTGDESSYAGYNGYFSYDASVVRLDSITKGNYTSTNFVSSTSAGSVEDHNTTIPNGSSLCVATFTCLTAGTVSITADFTMATMDATDVAASASTSVVISAAVPKSSDATLKSLTISPGTLSPAFSSGTQNYTATVSTSKITVSAAANSGKAKVSLNGTQNNLVEGTNTVKITVKAEDGSSKVYVITVTRISGPTPTPTPTPIPLPLINYKGTDYTILTPTDADGIPAGFSSAIATYQGVDIPVLSKTIGTAEDASQILLVFLVSDTVPSYFVYDDEADTCYPYSIISQNVGSYQIVDQTHIPDTPDGYEAFEYDYAGMLVTAYRLISNPDNPQILLYLCDENGVSSFYYYDTENGMLMLYRGAVSIVDLVTPQPTPSASTTNSPDVRADLSSQHSFSSLRTLLNYKNPVSILFYIISCIALILFAFVLLLLLKKPKDSEEFEESDLSAEGEDTKHIDVAPTSGDFLHEYAQPEAEREIYFGDAVSTDLVLPPDNANHSDSSLTTDPPVTEMASSQQDDTYPVVSEENPYVQIKPESTLPADVPDVYIEDADELRAEIREEEEARAELLALTMDEEPAVLPDEIQNEPEMLSSQSDPEPENVTSYLHIPVRLRQELESSQRKQDADPYPRGESEKTVQKQTPPKAPTPPKKSQPETYDPDFD